MREFAKMIRTLIPAPARNSERIGKDYAIFNFTLDGKRFTMSILPHDLEKPEAATANGLAGLDTVDAEQIPPRNGGTFAR